MQTLKQQIFRFGEDESMLSPVDFPVNPSPTQEKEKAQKMTAISGKKCLEQLEKFSQVGLLVKMFSACLVGIGGWYSTKCKLIWKLRGSSRSRMYFQLAVSTLHTKEIEFGLLPTPSATEG